MARSLHKLNDAFCRSASLKAGRYSDGGGLYLNVGPTGSKSWLFMHTRDGKRHGRGLGAFPAIKLAVARKKAEALRSEVAETGRLPELNPKHDPSFSECVELFLGSMDSQWRNTKHRAQWRMTLGPAYCSQLLQKPVSDVTTDDVLAVLSPVWTAKPETASRLRGRLERVLDFAKVRGWRSGENPAVWRGHLKNVLPPRRRLSRGHHSALPYLQVPNFMMRLRTSEAMAARALEFLILTASRTNEVLGAQWQELDLERRIWTIPAERMKAARLHRVPLSKRALVIISELKEHRQDEFLFPGQKIRVPLSSMSMGMLLRRMKVGTTVHGFRSSFRDWVSEETDFSSDVAEAALAHVNGSATERAYRRGDVLGKRREMMEVWARYCSGNNVDQ